MHMHMATKPLTHAGAARWVFFSQSGEGPGGGALDAHSAAPVFRSQLYQTNCTASLVSCRSRPAVYVAPAIPGVAACLCQAGCFAAPRPAFPPAPTCADLDIGHAAPGPPVGDLAGSARAGKSRQEQRSAGVGDLESRLLSGIKELDSLCVSTLLSNPPTPPHYLIPADTFHD